jgi:hypothetical protein
MRIIWGKETCSICGKPGVYLHGSKPEGYTPEYFVTMWFCHEHYHRFMDELKTFDKMNKERGEKANFIVCDGSPAATIPKY